MKYFRVIFTGLAIVFVGLSIFPGPRLNADPTDDLSLSLAQAQDTSAYNLMSERQIERVLERRLDLFPHSLTPRLARHLMALCQHYRFNPAFILSLIQVESAFKIQVVSDAGAVGLMQIMPATARYILSEWNIPLPAHADLQRALTDPFFNLTAGVAYLAMLRDHYPGRSPYYMLAAYNVGPAKMDGLLNRTNFHPVKTMQYYENIRRGIPDFRYFQCTNCE